MLKDTEEKSAIPYEYIKDPIYGYIRLYEHEREIIDTPSFQRLRRIKQLPSAHFVYPGATHTRFSHSLGVMYLSGFFASHLLEALKQHISPDVSLHFFFLVRLWGLTHDLGHGPFSHTFDNVILQEYRLTHEYMAAKIVQEDKDIAGIIEKKLRDFDIKPKTLAEYLGKTREEWSQPQKLGDTEHTEAAFYYILKGFYSTDIIDYLLRDNLYTGAGYGNFDWQRLILSSRLLEDEIALEDKARDTLDAFLLSRLFSFNTIYYHRWSRAVDHIIKSLLIKAKTKIDFETYTNDVNEYRKLDDESILHMNELRDIRERTMLMNRVIPFRRIDQIVRPVPDMPLLTEEDLNARLSRELGKKIPKEAYFVDTPPPLPLSPMWGEDKVCIIDTSTSPPRVSRELVRETSWGEIPYYVWTTRLYLDVNYEENKDEVKKAFRSLFPGEMPRPHY